jgi:hypothetical protein
LKHCIWADNHYILAISDLSIGCDWLKSLEVIIAIHISHKTGTQVRLRLAEGLDQVEIRSTGK